MSPLSHSKMYDGPAEGGIDLTPAVRALGQRGRSSHRAVIGIAQGAGFGAKSAAVAAPFIELADVLATALGHHHDGDVQAALSHVLGPELAEAYGKRRSDTEIAAEELARRQDARTPGPHTKPPSTRPTCRWHVTASDAPSKSAGTAEPRVARLPAPSPTVPLAARWRATRRVFRIVTVSTDGRPRTILRPSTALWGPGGPIPHRGLRALWRLCGPARRAFCTWPPLASVTVS